MVLKKYLLFFLLLISQSSFAGHIVVTATGNNHSEISACVDAKNDGQRLARNNQGVVVAFGACACEKANAGFNCTIEVRIKK